MEFENKFRSCPVCGEDDSKEIMRFSPDMLSAVNPTYKLEVLSDAVKGKEQLLSYSKCNCCKMVYCRNYWDDEVLTKVYRDTIDHSLSQKKKLSINRRRNIIKRWESILRMLTLQGKKELDIKLIDYGSGWGDFLDVAYGYGIDLMGYDEDLIKSEFAEKRGHKIAKNIDELKAFGPVDILTMNAVLEHLQDLPSSINLVKELLKPGGLFVFEVMDFRSCFIQNSIKLLNQGSPSLTKMLNPVEHVNVFDYASVMKIAKRYGFKVIATQNVLNMTAFRRLSANKKLIKLFNLLESIHAKLITWKPLDIIVYAINEP